MKTNYQSPTTQIIELHIEGTITTSQSGGELQKPQDMASDYEEDWEEEI